MKMPVSLCADCDPSVPATRERSSLFAETCLVALVQEQSSCRSMCGVQTYSPVFEHGEGWVHASRRSNAGDPSVRALGKLHNNMSLSCNTHEVTYSAWMGDPCRLGLLTPPCKLDSPTADTLAGSIQSVKQRRCDRIRVTSKGCAGT